MLGGAAEILGRILTANFFSEDEHPTAEMFNFKVTHFLPSHIVNRNLYSRHATYAEGFSDSVNTENSAFNTTWFI